jgi:site-specific DNA-methyltransferase (adenine-specific)
LEKGRGAYETVDKDALAILTGMDVVPVQRNKGIDAFINYDFVSGSIPVRIQRANESLDQAAQYLHEAAKSKHAALMVLVASHTELALGTRCSIPNMIVVDATAKAIDDAISKLRPVLSSSIQGSKMHEN